MLCVCAVGHICNVVAVHPQSNPTATCRLHSNPTQVIPAGGDSWDTALSTMRCSTASQYGSTCSCSAGSKEPHRGVHRSMTLVAVSVCLRCRALRWSLVLFVRYLPLPWMACVIVESVSKTCPNTKAAKNYHPSRFLVLRCRSCTSGSRDEWSPSSGYFESDIKVRLCFVG